MTIFDLKDVKPVQFLKFALVVLLGLLILAFVFSLAGSTFTGPSLQSGKSTISSRAPVGVPEYSGVMDGAAEMAYDEDVALSQRNIAPIYPPEPGHTPGSDAEAFEVTEYSAHIETKRKDDACGAILELKSREDVIFDHASEHERGCSYRFKTEHSAVVDVLTVIESLDPRELTERSYTIKQRVTDYTSEIEILTNKLNAIDETLAQATIAYDEITDLARRTGDAEALASVIDSKVRIIEKLTQERISVVAELDRLSRQKAEQLDRLIYTYFAVTIEKQEYIDEEQLADSWKAAVRQSVMEVNRTLQDMTVNFAVLLLMLVKVALYFIVLLIVAKFGWRYTKRFWNQ